MTTTIQFSNQYQQPFETYLHYHPHPISAAISKVNYLAGCMALIHGSTFMVALL